MNEHRKKVLSGLSNLEGRSRLFFGLLAAERLRGCCFVACGEGGFWEVYASTIEHFFGIICNRQPLEMNTIHDAAEALEQIVPNGGDPLQAQGQSSAVCLLESLRFVQTGDLDAAETLINSVIEALDNYVFLVRKSITGQTTSPEDYGLLTRELQRQVDDLVFVTHLDSHSEIAVIERRIDNLQYAIPVAVWGKTSPEVDTPGS